MTTPAPTETDMPDATPPSGQLSPHPRSTQLFAFTVTGNTVFGEPATVVGATPAPDFAAAEAAVRLAQQSGRFTPITPGRLPEMDVRVTVFRLPLTGMADVLKANRYRVQEPPARAAGHPHEGV